MHVHLIIDSPVFTPVIISRVTEVQDDVMICITKSWNDIKVSHLGTTSNLDCYSLSKLLMGKEIEVFHIHFFSTTAAIILRLIKNIKHVRWYVWGGDLYLRKRISQSLNVHSTLSGIKGWLSEKVLDRAISQVDSVVANPCDLAIVKQYYPAIKTHIELEHLQDLTQVTTLALKPKQGSCLIGNSEDISNDHGTLLSIIKELNDVSRLIIPLAGANEEYLQQVTHDADSSKSSVEILTTQLSKDEFYSRVGGCSHLIFGHRRQQGMATLFSFLLSGRTCILNGDSPYTRYLIESGFNIFTLKELKQSNSLPVNKQQEVEQNIKLLKAKLDPDKIKNQWSEALCDV